MRDKGFSLHTESYLMTNVRRACYHKYAALTLADAADFVSRILINSCKKQSTTSELTPGYLPT